MSSGPPVPLPTEEQAATYLETHVTTDGDGRHHRSSPGFAEVRHALDEAAVPRGHAVLVTASDVRTQLTAFLAAHYAGLVPVLLPRACPEQRTLLVARALGAPAVLGTVPTTGKGGGEAIAVRTLRSVRPTPYGPGHAILMTSGTSGAASGCLHHMTSLFVNARRHVEAIGLRASDTVLVNLPLHYSFALVAQALAGLVTGARLVLSGPPFAPPVYERTLVRHGITVSSLSPTLVRTFLQETRDLPGSLRVLTVGGDALETTHVRELRKRHPDGELYLTYGLTEAGPRVATLAAHREPETRYTSVGRPLSGVCVRLRAPGPEGVGELLVTTGTAMIRRVGWKDAARRDLVAPGTIATGDAFRTDPDGYLYFCGRLSDFIVVSGDKVSLRWVREMVGALPGVLHVRTEIVRAPADRGGHTRQRYRLHVVAKDVTPGLRNRVMRRIREVLLRVEFPCDVVFTEQREAEFSK